MEQIQQSEAELSTVAGSITIRYFRWVGRKELFEGSKGAISIFGEG